MNAPNLPAYLQGLAPSRITQTLSQNLGQGTPPYLSILGGRFNLIDAVGNESPVPTYDPTLGPYVDCMIVDVNEHMSKIYYDHPFDPSASQYSPPTCFSDNGVAPSRNAGTPQSPMCAACPNGAWGSATSKVSGKGIKACQDYYKLALVVPPHKTAFLLRVPPNSLSKLREYQGRFVGQGIGVEHVVTRISFVPGVQGTLQFQATNYLPEEMFRLGEEIRNSKASDALVGRLDTPHPASAGALAAPTQAALPALATQPGPFVAAAPGPAPNAAGGPAPATASPSEQPAQQGRRRRNTAPVQQPVPGATGAQAASPQAPFPTSAPPAAAPVQPAPAAGPAFGIQSGVAPDPALAATLQSVFGTPGQ